MNAVEIVCSEVNSIILGEEAITLDAAAVAILACPEPYVPHPNPGPQDIPCVLRCILPLYDMEEIRKVFWTSVVPALLGSALCCSQLVRVFYKRQTEKRKRRESLFVVIYCTLGLLYGLLHTIPVAVLFTDLPCSLDTIVDKGTGALCTLNRMSSALLISMYYWMAAHVVSMYLKIVRAERYAQFSRKCTLEIVAIVVCVGVPLLSAILIFALDVGYDPAAPLFSTHVARDNFTCSPRFRTLAIEIATVHIHFIICSVVIVGGLVRVARYIAIIVLKRDPHSSHTTIARNIWRAGPRVFLLAFQMLVLLAIHTALAIELVPQWKAFGDASEEWIMCKRLEEACVEVEATIGTQLDECDGSRSCVALLQDRPSVALLQLGNFANTGIIWVVGFTFFVFDCSADVEVFLLRIYRTISSGMYWILLCVKGRHGSHTSEDTDLEVLDPSQSSRSSKASAATGVSSSSSSSSSTIEMACTS